MMASLQQMETRLARLGSPKWKDPERRQSIKIDSRVKMEWKLKAPLRTMSCWIATSPAKPCLTEAIGQIDALVEKRKHDIWDGEHTTPACVWDRSMYGRSINDAQPTIIFSSSSKIIRRNAKQIIRDENIQVDPRGIGIEYYETSPEFMAGTVDLEAGRQAIPPFDHPFSEAKGSVEHQRVPSYSSSQNVSMQKASPKPNVSGALVRVGSVSCTVGGVLVIKQELYCLTVAHAFETDSGVLQGNQG
jgi:hypothetical protein